MPYASNWLERLRRIKNLRQKVSKDFRNFASKTVFLKQCHLFLQVLSEQNSGQNLSADGANGGTEKESQWNKEDFTQYTQ